MFPLSRPRRALVASVLALVLLAPPASRAEEISPPAGSPLGVVFAVLCGAGVSITRLAPGVPIVVAVTAVACAGMFLDAIASPDP